MRRAAPLLAVAALAGCAYYNGIYNARQAERHGDALARDGHTAEALALYTAAAQKAESVLARHPHTRWAGDAILIAGRSWAMAGRCDRAEPRLTTFLTRGAEREDRLARATLALGVCRVREGRPAEGRQLLAPLTQAVDRRVAAEASLWASLASIALGQRDSARAYLRGANEARADWLLAQAFIARGDFAPAESLLSRRARRGDYHDELLDALRALAKAGHEDAVERIVARYDAARAGEESRARLHLLAGELDLADGGDSAAAVHFAAAQRLSHDTTVARDASARLTIARIRNLPLLVDVENVIARGRAAALGSELQRRLDDNLLLVQMLAAEPEPSGATRFLAAEVARDSLRAIALAAALFRDVIATPHSALAPKALLAAAALDPDSAAAYRRALRTQYPNSVYAALADSSAAARVAQLDPAEAILARTWAAATRTYADSLRKLHPELGIADRLTTPPATPDRPTPPPPR